MKYKLHPFREADIIFTHEEKYSEDWYGLKAVLNSITDDDLIDAFLSSERASIKSLSEPINKLIDERLVAAGWQRQSAIFNASEYRPRRNDSTWTLDFAKGQFAVEVGFNHGSAVAWNLIKPVLSSELNHVEKALQTSAGIIIAATDDLKKAGNFDNAVGSYEKYQQYLAPFRNILTVPMMLIGLEPPESFRIDPKTRQIVLRGSEPQLTL